MSIPLWMKMHIRRHGRTKVRLWIPLFLLWILLLPLLVLTVPFILLAALFTWAGGPGPSLLRIYPLLGAVIWNLPGLHIQVEGEGDQILMIIH